MGNVCGNVDVEKPQKSETKDLALLIAYKSNLR